MTSTPKNNRFLNQNVTSFFRGVIEKRPYRLWPMGGRVKKKISKWRCRHLLIAPLKYLHSTKVVEKPMYHESWLDYIIPLDVVSVHMYVEYVPLGDLKSFYQDETSFIKGFIKRKKAECIFSKEYIFTYILLTYLLWHV